MAKQQRIDPRVVEKSRQTQFSAINAKNARTQGTSRGRSGRPGGRTVVETRPATLGTWIAGARLPTLLLAIGPVVLGTGLAARLTVSWYDHWVRALLALAVALALQIAVNYANDYSDGIRGTDKVRVGPERLVGSGRARPRTVLIVALVFAGIGALAGATLIVLSGIYWLFAFGVLALAAGWFYTGGKRPYGYLGLGEIVAFLFFGVAPVVGTMLTQVGEVNADGWLGGAAMGAFAAAVLLVNNLRDRESDRVSGKRTIAVLLGDLGARIVYALLMLLPFGLLVPFVLLYDNAVYVYFALMAAAPAIVIVLLARHPRELVYALRLTLVSSLLFGVGLALAVAF